MPSDREPDAGKRQPDAPYDRARRDFDEMPLEDRARFLVEATASTLARTVEAAGRELARGIGELFGQAREQPAPGRSRRPGPAEPETAQRTAPPNGSRRPGGSGDAPGGSADRKDGGEPDEGTP
jgi:hypothetical protein